MCVGGKKTEGPPKRPLFGGKNKHRVWKKKNGAPQNFRKKIFPGKSGGPPKNRGNKRGKRKGEGEIENKRGLKKPLLKPGLPAQKIPQLVMGKILQNLGEDRGNWGRSNFTGFNRGKQPFLGKKGSQSLNRQIPQKVQTSYFRFTEGTLPWQTPIPPQYQITPLVNLVSQEFTIKGKIPTSKSGRGK